MGIPTDTAALWTEHLRLTGVDTLSVDTAWTPVYGENSRISPVRDTINMVREVLRIRYNGWAGRYDRARTGNAAVPRAR